MKQARREVRSAAPKAPWSTGMCHSHWDQLDQSSCGGPHLSASVSHRSFAGSRAIHEGSAYSWTWLKSRLQNRWSGSVGEQTTVFLRDPMLSAHPVLGGCPWKSGGKEQTDNSRTVWLRVSLLPDLSSAWEKGQAEQQQGCSGHGSPRRWKLS